MRNRSGTESDARFRGWARPGPVPPGGPGPEPGETLDAHCGSWRIFQLERGHRFSTDDLVAAWFGALHAPHAARILDLGSGIGSVALAAAFRLPGAHVTTVEAQPESARLARKSVAWNGLAERFDVREGDLRDLDLGGEFDLVLGAPPYFPDGTATPPDHAQADAARMERRGDVADYAAAAARHLAPGGLFAFVHLAARVAEILGALRGAGLVPLHLRRVVFREGEPPRVALFAASRTDGLPEDFAARRDLPFEPPPLVIRRTDGRHTLEYGLVRLTLGFPPGDL